MRSRLPDCQKAIWDEATHVSSDTLMAQIGKKAQRDGWQHQAMHLALTHTAPATMTATAMTAAEQAQRRRSSERTSYHFQLQVSEAHPTNELETARTKADEPDPDAARRS